MNAVARGFVDEYKEEVILLNGRAYKVNKYEFWREVRIIVPEFISWNIFVSPLRYKQKKKQGT